MKTFLLLMCLAFTAGAQTTKQDSIHQKYHLMRKDPKQKSPYAFADTVKAKKSVRPKKKTK